MPTASYRKTEAITSPWALPRESGHSPGTRPSGNPAHTHTRAHTHAHRIPWGRGLGRRVCVLTPASNTDHFATALRHFGFPRTRGAFWERGATPRPNGSSPGPQRGGDCAASAEGHRALRPGPALNKEGLFNVAVGLSAAAAGADTIVSGAPADADASSAPFFKGRIASSPSCAYLFTSSKIVHLARRIAFLWR